MKESEFNVNNQGYSFAPEIKRRRVEVVLTKRKHVISPVAVIALMLIASVLPAVFM